MKGTDDEVDTGEIEEEDWVECMKRSTATAVERMKAARIPCWTSSKTELRPQHHAPDQQTIEKTKKEMGR